MTQRPSTLLHEAVALLADMCRCWRCNRLAAGSCWSMCRPHCLSAQTWQQTRCSRTCLQVGRGQAYSAQLLRSAVVFCFVASLQPAGFVHLAGTAARPGMPVWRLLRNAVLRWFVHLWRVWCPADPLIQRLIDDPTTFLRTTQTLGAESASVQDITTQMTQRAKWRHHLQLHAILWPTLAGCLLLAGLGSWGWRRRRRRQLQLAQIASGRAEPGGAVATGGLAALFGSSLQQRGHARGGSAAGHEQWSYGDGFMSRGAAAPAGDDAYLSRMSNNSSDAGDVAGRHGQRGLAETWRDLQWLLSSRVRFVFKVQGPGHAGGRAGCSGASSPGSTDSPGRSSCGASDADSMERGVDEYRVNVLVAGSSGSEAQQAPSPHQHDLCLREESFAARLRPKQPRPE